INRMLIVMSLGLGLLLGAENDTFPPSTTFVHPDAPGKLSVIGNVAVVLNGVDQPTNRLFEDVLTMLVMSESIPVVYPGEKEVGKPRHNLPEPIEFARKVGANCLITGSVVAGCNPCPRCKGDCANEELRAVSLSLIDVPQDKILLWALYEPKKNTSPVEICRSFVRLLLDSLKESDQKEQKE
ncbi:MAG: hypothetical protein ACUVUR_06095, partial [bacterium]